jgi:hypothetical protein
MVNGEWLMVNGEWLMMNENKLCKQLFFNTILFYGIKMGSTFEPLAKLAFSSLDLEIRFFCSESEFLKPRFELRNPIFFIRNQVF